MAKLTSSQRNALPARSFAGPDRSYPIPDESHARNALSRAAQNAGPVLEAKIRAKVRKRFPGIGKPEATKERISSSEVLRRFRSGHSHG